MTTPQQLVALDGEVALVTGASRGIGSAVADLLGAAGATVVGSATSQAGAEAISQRFAEQGITGRGVVLDVTEPDQIQAVAKDIAANEGAVTILVNNAGITRDGLLMRMQTEAWDAVIATNLSSAFLLSKACMRGMVKARRGRIINIGSVVGSMGNAGQSNYAAAKAGLAGFTKSLARELGGRGITVNTIAPGFIETEMTAALGEEQINDLTGQIPLQRLGSVCDIASAVLYLSGPGGAYITGETLHVNGGMVMA